MSTSELVRSFIAITPPPDVIAEVVSMFRRCKKALRDERVSWIREENLHITLRFLGNVSRECLDMLLRDLEERYHRLPAFELRLHGIEILPSVSRPRVLSLAVEADGDRLEALRVETDAVCERAGLEPDTKPFQAHMTLARFRSQRVPGAVASVLKEYEKSAADEFIVESVSLFESTLTNTGPVYTCLKEFRLYAN